MKTRASGRPTGHRPATPPTDGGDAPLYAGMWVDDEPYVTVTRGGKTEPLESPRGLTDQPGLPFAWGFSGPSCAHLALAILADYLAESAGGETRALEMHAEFHTRVVASLPNAWALSGEFIADFLDVLSL